MKDGETKAFWAAYRAATGVPDQAYDVVSFGDSPELADELLALVRTGRKRGTASLLRDYAPGAVPKPGDHVLVLDGAGVPACIWRTVRIDILPFIEVGEDFAAAEGEGDGSLAYWREGHRRYFGRQAEREGFAFDERIEVVCERFEIVWPPEMADRQGGATSPRASGS